MKNGERLEKNRPPREATVPGGPPREGSALLQGLLLCGQCGRGLHVSYRSQRDLSPLYQCVWLYREGVAGQCIRFRADLLDAAITEEVLKALQPAELEMALAAVHELELRDQVMLRQWQMRLERAEYEAALAERRYQEADPSNRLVAGTLERRWNDALVQLDDLKKQAAEFQRQEAHVVTPEQREKILALARDLPRLWLLPARRPRIASECCACSSRILPSSYPSPGSSWPTSAGRAALVRTYLSSSRLTEPTPCAILQR